MKTSAFACTAVLALATACFHAKQVADPRQEERAAREGSEEQEATQEEQGADGEKKDEGGDSEREDGAAQADAPARKKAPTARRSSDRRAAADEKADGENDKGGDDLDPEDIPVASSPQGLLKPGAEEKVREKLGVAKGAGMRKALMSFQREHDLPATGMLDHETVERLGLDPKDIFRKEG